MLMLNMTQIDLVNTARLLEEAAAVLARVREAHSNVWEQFQQREPLAAELEASAAQLRQARL